MKLNKKDIISILIFIITFFIIYFLLIKDGYIFASTTDFRTQHYLIPDYFRKLFYDTLDIFPDYVFNLGGGQNIYYFSYYGLLNPIILISYLLPFIKMIDYLIISNILIVIISTILFYFYLKKNKYNYKTCFIISFLFLCSGPLIFHAHRHIMFINYMPFLIMGFYGVDKFLEKNNIKLLTLSIFLMIMTSYYYSVSGIVVLYILLIYKYLKLNKKINIKNILKTFIPFILGITMGMVIILPTLYTLLNGRNTTTKVINIVNLLKPSINILYDPYSPGVTLISLISLVIMLFNKEKQNKILSIILLFIVLFPIFNYILNGTLYVNPKSLIPFMPLILIVTANILDKIFKNKINYIQIILIIYLITSSFIICLFVNKQEVLITKESIQNEDVEELINYITNIDKGYYRISNLVEYNSINKVTNIKEYKTTLYSSTYNNNYNEFYYDIINNNVKHRNRLMTSDTQNILFNTIMGSKYVITKNKLDLELIKEKNNIKLYKNDKVLPIGYASNNIINETDFDNLEYPSNVVNLLNGIVTNSKTNINLNKLEKFQLNYEITNYKNLEIKNNEIKANNKAYMNIKINDDLTNKILIIKFKNNNNPDYDISISINNIQNKLTAKNWKYHNKNNTFNYVLYSPSELKIKFTEGLYKISDLEFYILDYNVTEFDKFNIESIKGDIIKGNINVLNNSYFNISIPYDKGYKIYVDNKLTKYEKTNKSFIGFKIDKGNHDIKIIYEAPYKKISIIISLISIIILLVIKNKIKL